MRSIFLCDIKALSHRVTQDPTLYGRIAGYGFLGAMCTANILIWVGIVLCAMAIAPLLLLGVPIGFIVSRLCDRQPPLNRRSVTLGVDPKMRHA